MDTFRAKFSPKKETTKLTKSNKKKFVVAFTYWLIPKFDKFTVDGKKARLYVGERCVGEMEMNSLPSMKSNANLDIRIINAETELEAFGKLLRAFPYFITKMISKEVKGDGDT